MKITKNNKEYDISQMSLNQLRIFLQKYHGIKHTYLYSSMMDQSAICINGVVNFMINGDFRKKDKGNNITRKAMKEYYRDKIKDLENVSA